MSNITERVIQSAKEWQQRTLEPVYFAVWMDVIIIKIRDDKKVINKCIYIVIGLKPNGLKEVLGFWIEKTESVAFWMSVLTDLKARGVEDILIACIDNLKGFTQAIAAVFPEAVTTTLYRSSNTQQLQVCGVQRQSRVLQKSENILHRYQ